MRREDWPLRLSAAIEAARGRPFAWGTHDCALFAADTVLAMTGDDHGAVFRGVYADAAGAARVIAAAGGLAAIATRALGYPIPVPCAGRGDVVLLTMEGRESLGICLGVDAAFTGADGLVFAPTHTCAQAWRV